jgi:hypothetical protein
MRSEKMGEEGAKNHPPEPTDRHPLPFRLEKMGSPTIITERFKAFLERYGEKDPEESRAAFKTLLIRDGPKRGDGKYVIWLISTVIALFIAISAFYYLRPGSKEGKKRKRA